jgi:hypothetical protein
MAWSDPFWKPIKLNDGRVLRTLGDAFELFAAAARPEASRRPLAGGRRDAFPSIDCAERSGRGFGGCGARLESGRADLGDRLTALVVL